MSRVPASEKFDIYQGGTMDETWFFWLDAAHTQPEDLSVYASAEFRVAKDTLSASLKKAQSGGTAPPAASAVVITGNGVRIYLTDEDTLALTEDNFVRSGKARDGFEYSGICTLLMTKTNGEVDIINLGPVAFHPIAES